MGEPDWLAELSRLAEVKADIDGLVLKAVKGARRAGISWYDIGPAMGVTRQAVAEKYTPLMPAALRGNLRMKAKA